MALDLLKWNKATGEWAIPDVEVDKIDPAYLELKTVNGNSLSGSGNVTISGSTSITQTEVDFGATPIAEQKFTITDAAATISSKIMATLAYDAPTSKDLDEVEMDDLIIKCGNATAGFFEMFIRAVDGSYLSGKFKINYIIA